MEFEEEYTDIKDKCYRNDVYFKYYQYDEVIQQNKEIKVEDESTLKINTPVIFVLGIIKYTRR